MINALVGPLKEQLARQGRRLCTAAALLSCAALLLVGAVIFALMALHDVLMEEMSYRAASLVLAAGLLIVAVIVIFVGRGYMKPKGEPQRVATSTADAFASLTAALSGLAGKPPLSPFQLVGLALLAGFMAGRRRR